MWMIECVGLLDPRLDTLLEKGWEPFAASGNHDVFLRIESDNSKRAGLHVTANGVRVCPFCYDIPWDARHPCPCGEEGI